MVWDILDPFHFLSPLALTRCDHLVVIQVVQTTFVELVAQIIMTLRVYALSQRNRYILGALSIHIVGQFGLGLYLSAFSDHGLQSLSFGFVPSCLTTCFL